MLTPEQEYNSTIAYLTFPEEYEKYCSNATWAGEDRKVDTAKCLALKLEDWYV